MMHPHDEQKQGGGKVSNLLRKALTQFQEALKEELHSPTTDRASPATASAVAEQATDVDRLIETSDGVDQGIEALHGHHKTLGRQIDIMLGLTPEEQHQVVSLMWQTLVEMEQAVTTVQEANSSLRRVLREKRLLLDTRNQSLSAAQQREATLLNTVDTLRKSNAQLARDLRACQDKLTHQEKSLARVQQQYNTLSQQHTELVGDYHRRFQASFRTASEAREILAKEHTHT